MKKMLSFLALALILGFAVAARATKLKTGDFSFISKDEVISEDVYMAGGTLDIDGKVDGDVIVAGGTVNVTGEISQDLAIAGGNIKVEGKIGDDVRIAGGNLDISGEVTGDVIALGGNINFLRNSKVTGSIFLAGGQTNIAGDVKKDLRGYTGSLILKGTVGGDVNIEADSLIVDSGAKIEGDLKYKSPNQATINSGAEIGGETIFEKRAAIDYQDARTYIVSRITGWAMALFVGLLLVFLTPKTLEKTKEIADKSLGKTALWGFLALIAVPIITILLLITTIGVSAAFILVLAYIIALMVSGTFAAYWLGTKVKDKYQIKSKRPRLLAMFLGITILAVLGLIPVIGSVIAFVAFLVGLGQVSIFVVSFLRNQRPKQAKKA